MTRVWVIRLLAAFAVLGLTISAASADEGATTLSARMTGFNETPPGPFLTDATGTFSATVQGDQLTYTLSYTAGLTSPVIMAHIHFAQPGVAGGIFLWLCGSATKPGPAGTPSCPPVNRTVTRTVMAADFQAIPGQNVPANDFAGALRIIRAGDAYVNVHTVNNPGGEIRGQVHVGESD